MGKTGLRTALFILLAAVFLYFFARSVSWPEVLRSVAGVKWPLFALSCLLSGLHFFTRSLRWKFLLKHEKPEARYVNMVKGNVVGFTVTFLFPGRLGELVKPLYLAQKEDMSKGYVIGTVVVERIFDMSTMCLFLGLFLLARPLYAGRFSLGAESLARLNLWGLVGTAFAVGLLAFALAVYFFREKALAAAAFLVRPLPERPRAWLLNLFREFIEGLKFFRSGAELAVYAGLSAVVWLGIIFFYWVFFLAYGLKVPFFLMVPYIFLTMVGASIPTPGMAGGFDYFSKLGLTTLYGAGPDQAVAVTLVTHALQVVVTCLAGYAIVARDGLSLFELKRMGEEAKK